MFGKTRHSAPVPYSNPGETSANCTLYRSTLPGSIIRKHGGAAAREGISNSQPKAPFDDLSRYPASRAADRRCWCTQELQPTSSVTAITQRLHFVPSHCVLSAVPVNVRRQPSLGVKFRTPSSSQ